jgi:eukaryotic-like serine/threonine-protein kinase
MLDGAVRAASTTAPRVARSAAPGATLVDPLSEGRVSCCPTQGGSAEIFVKVCPLCKQRYPHESSFCFVDGATLEALSDPRLGTTIAGRYVLEEVLGEGGMATVYRARHKLVDRPCAVKILHGEVTREPNVKERFRREALHAQRLAHPNIIEVFDQGETDEGTSFLVMELLPARAWRTSSRGARCPSSACSGSASRWCARSPARTTSRSSTAILKPENVFVLPSDRIKLLDFGIARGMQETRLTSVGEIFGTPEYMAPEQGTSTEAGPGADVYSLGIILFEMLSGALPFEAPNAPTMLVKHLSEPVPHVRDRAPKVPEALDELIHSMMAKSPADRPVDAQAVQVRLTRIAAELGIEVPTEPELEAPPPSRQIRPGEAQLWDRRTQLFESMLRKAFTAGAPPDMERMLGELRAKVAEVAELRSSAFEEQQKLEIIEAEGREGRLRFGQAMDTLSVDASRMREEARSLRQGQAAPTEPGTSFAERMREAHREAIAWEGRCAFVEPHPELAKAYRELAEIVDAWVVKRRSGARRRTLRRRDRSSARRPRLPGQGAALRPGEPQPRRRRAPPGVATSHRRHGKARRSARGRASPRRHALHRAPAREARARSALPGARDCQLVPALEPARFESWSGPAWLRSASRRCRSSSFAPSARSARGASSARSPPLSVSRRSSAPRSSAACCCISMLRPRVASCGRRPTLLLGSLFQGSIELGEIRRLHFGGAELESARIIDPAALVVAEVEGVRATIDTAGCSSPCSARTKARVRRSSSPSRTSSSTASRPRSDPTKTASRRSRAPSTRATLPLRTRSPDRSSSRSKTSRSTKRRTRATSASRSMRPCDARTPRST